MALIVGSAIRGCEIRFAFLIVVLIGPRDAGSRRARTLMAADYGRGGRMRSIDFSLMLTLLCAVNAGAASRQASAQCAAQDVAGNRHLAADSSFLQTPEVIQSAAGIPIWKTIKLGTTNKWDLLAALDAANCGVGDAAEEMFAQPQFTVSTTKLENDLVIVSVAELGMDGAPLKAIHARARSLGFAVPAAEIGPQLRLQYIEQPLGEFLNIGMAPIKTHDDRSGIFVIGNGGVGLLLVGADAGDGTEFHAAARFVFVRPKAIASSQATSD
jgi:hypothetical protein